MQIIDNNVEAQKGDARAKRQLRYHENEIAPRHGRRSGMRGEMFHEEKSAP